MGVRCTLKDPGTTRPVSSFLDPVTYTVYLLLSVIHVCTVSFVVPFSISTELKFCFEHLVVSQKRNKHHHEKCLSRVRH